MVVTAPARVRQRDVAHHAGVSISTVSRVFSGSPGIGPELTARVQAAAAALGYRAFVVAPPALRRVALLSTIRAAAQGAFYADILTGVEQECRAHGAQLSYTVLEMGPDTVTRMLAHLDATGADGVLLLAVDDRAAVAALLAGGMRVVLVNAEHPTLPVDTLLPDNPGGMMLAVEHLLAHGHRDLLHVTRLHRTTFTRRRDAFFVALAAAGIAPDPARVVDVPLDAAGAQAAMRAHLAAGVLPPFTAVCCANDLAAVGVIRALREAGRRVPDDVSVVGFDDLAVAALVEPPLTTVRVERDELGRLAVRRLLERAADPHRTPVRVELACRLVVRDSVAVRR